MDTVFLFLARMLILQCFLHCCSPDEKTRTRTLESFMRGNTENRFLKAKWDQSKKAHELSFTGRKNEDNTIFIFKHENNNVTDPFTIHLAGDEKYLLAVNDNGSGLVVEKQSDTREDRTTKASYKFNLERVSLLLANGTDLSYLHVIRSQVGKRKAIKSRKSGLVSLGKKDDCGYWIRITATTSGN